MDTITTAARQRAVMATIADLIVAAAAGRTLRVAVGRTHPDETAFADQLTQALHARGRPSHCLTAKPKPVTTDRYTRARSDADGLTVAVITSGTPDPDETELCRINIQLYTPNRVTPPAPSTHMGADGQHRGSVGGRQPDIIVDYLDHGGAAIRHLGPALAARPSSAGSLSDRRVRPP
jgi:hypothetical protein